jgi:hypothetical protein
MFKKKSKTHSEDLLAEKIKNTRSESKSLSSYLKVSVEESLSQNTTKLKTLNYLKKLLNEKKKALEDQKSLKPPPSKKPKSFKSSKPLPHNYGVVFPLSPSKQRK